MVTLHQLTDHGELFEPVSSNKQEEFLKVPMFKISKILTGTEYFSKISLPKQIGSWVYLLLIGGLLVMADEQL